MPETEDIALNKPATQSSVSQWSRGDAKADAQGANSDFVAGDYAFHTEREKNPWWQVDLEDEFVIESVKILNRKLHTPHLLRHFSLLKSFDGHNWEMIFQKTDDITPGGPDDVPFEIILKPDVHVARFLRVRLDGEEYLHFRKFQAFGYKHQPAVAEVLAAPEPATPEPAAPEPAAPEPSASEPAAPEPAAPEPAAQKPAVTAPAAEPPPPPTAPPQQPPRPTSFWSFLFGR